MTDALDLATTTTLRNAELGDLVTMLRAQADLRYDVVVSAADLRYDGGNIHVSNGAMRLDEDGIDTVDAVLRPTGGCEGQMADRLGIPPRYISRMREDAIARLQAVEDDASAAALLDHNVNHWLDRDPARRFLLRGFRTDDPDAIGVARALLSDRFSMVDNLDVLMAALEGVRQAGVNVEIRGCSLTERRMSVNIVAPEVQALAPVLLRGYRNPFGPGGLERPTTPQKIGGGDAPIVFAGFQIGNSETGGGAFTLAPRLLFKICDNGLTVKADALREIHLGSKMEEGLIRWSAETTRKAIDLVTAKTADAVATFLDVDYVTTTIARLEEVSDTPVREPVKQIERLAKQFGFTQAEQDSILTAFVAGGQPTAGGILNAVTAAAQTVAEPDRAADLEAVAIEVMTAVAAA